MRVEIENGRLILTEPKTLKELILMGVIHTIITQAETNRVTFEVTSSAAKDNPYNPTQITLKPIIPPEFGSDEIHLDLI